MGIPLSPRRINSTADLIWRSLVDQPVRTVLSALSVALGVGIITANGVVITGIEDAWAGSTNVMADFIDTVFGVLFTGMGVVFSAAAGFLIFNAFAMSVTRRQQEIGAMRALGMTRRQVAQQILAEALVTGVLGAAAGLVLGPLVGNGLMALLRQTGLEIGTGHLRLPDVIIGIAAGMVIPALAALIPARRAARVSPLEALRRPTIGQGDRIRPTRVVIGLLLLVVLLIYVITAPPGEWAGKKPPWEWIMAFVLWAAWFTSFGLLAPTLIGGIVRLLRGPLIRLWRVNGRLAADNLTRSRGRVTTTVVAFAVAMTAAVGAAGLVTYNNTLVQINADRAMQRVSWTVLSYDSSTGLSQLNIIGSTAFFLSQEVIDDVLESTEGLALVSEAYTVQIPALSSPIPGFPSYVVDPRHLSASDSYRFSEGDWETALPIMESGCGVLVTESVAGRFGAGVGDAITVDGVNGPVTCTIAGLGGGGVVAWTFIGIGAKDLFVPAGRLPDALNVLPLEGVEAGTVEAALNAVAARHPSDAFVVKVDDQIEGILETSDQLMDVFGVFVVLAQAAAALGIINTTLVSVTERRHELGLLRAVGGTRRQVTAVVTGEAALMGLIGVLLGVVLGAGMSALYGLAQGGLPFGIADLDIWQTALGSVPPALAYGWIGFAAAPLLAAGAAYPVVRSILRGSAIETLYPVRSTML